MKPVLIVDDDPTVCRVVATTLRRRGYEVTAVPNGAECLRTLRQGFRGLILMDVLMPGLSGWQTVRILAQEGLLAGCVVCMLTGVVDPNDEAEGLQEWILDYLTKPFEAHGLVGMVEQAMVVLREPGEK